MQIDLTKYDFFVFDCDGVILDSNLIKTQAFKESLLNYPDEQVLEFLAYHRENGGISRYYKFNYFFDQIMKMENYEQSLQTALKDYANILEVELLSCSFVPGVIKFLSLLNDHKKDAYVNSGSSENELNKIFKLRGINNFFKEIKGSPDSKYSNMNHIFNDRKKGSKGLFFGDSLVDFQVANKFSIDFIYVESFSEWKDFPKNITKIEDFEDLKELII